MKSSTAKTYRVSGTVWLYPGENGNWHFFTVPKRESEELKERYRGLTKGWGSLPVTVTIGKTVWKTSIFPESKSGTFMLPIKAVVRKREGILEGDEVRVSFFVTL